MTVPSPAQILADSATYIEQHGWIQGDAENRRGEVCALGAIGRVSYAPEIPKDARWDLYDEAVELLSSYLHKEIIQWNDALGRTAEDVITAMKEAAHVESR